MWRYRHKEELLGQEIANNLEYKSDTLQTLQTEGSLKDTDKGLIHIPSLFLQEAPDENWPQEHRPQTDWNQKANEAWCQPMKLHLDANQSENCVLITCPGGPLLHAAFKIPSEKLPGSLGLSTMSCLFSLLGALQ